MGLSWGTYTITPAGFEWLEGGGMPKPSSSSAKDPVRELAERPSEEAALEAALRAELEEEQKRMEEFERELEEADQRQEGGPPRASRGTAEEPRGTAEPPTRNSLAWWPKQPPPWPLCEAWAPTRQPPCWSPWGTIPRDS